MRAQVLSALLGFAITALPMAPVVHVHRAEDSDGHEHVVAHTHSEAHHLHIEAGEDHDGAAIDHDDSVLVTFDPLLAVPTEHVVVTPALSQTLLVDAPIVVVRGYSVEFVELLIHGPPRAPSHLRGPPVPTLL